MPGGCCRRRRSWTMCGTTTSTARPTSSSPTSPTCAARSTRPSRGCCTRSAGWATPCGSRVVPERAEDMAIATNADLDQPTDAAATSEGLLESAPAAEEPRPPRPPRAPRIPLRITLVALMVLLVAVGLGATGLTATSLLRGYLTEQQDARLSYALQNAQHRPDVFQACLRGQNTRTPSGAYYACLPPGTDELVVVQGPPSDGDLPEVDAPTAEELAESDVTTVPSVEGSTHWRLIGGSLTNGWTVVIGSDLSRDQAAIHRLVTIEVVVGLIVLVVLGATGYVMVRNSLRPLTEVEH